ncbi:hypothetical protein BH11ACT3_BH11ACT3_08960 [soil metagenome]
MRPMTSPAGSASGSQEIRFARAPDGVRIAYAIHGEGPPLLVSTCWLSHLQHDWESPVWRHFLADLGRFATVIRFDERGHGLSDWNVQDFSLEARIGDLEAVADAAGFDRFALMGMAQGGPVSIEYTARHPDRVTRLLFHGSFVARMRNASAEDVELTEVYASMIRVGWARPESSFRRVFTTQMIPDATEEQMQWIDDLQKVSVSATTAATAYRERLKSDATLAVAHIDVPTLVLHSRGDAMVPFERGVELASSIAGARLVALESQNHIVLEDEPAWPVFLDEVEAFLAPDREARGADGRGVASSGLAGGASVPGTEVLSARELEVLGLAARGHDNDEIATILSLSGRTVERHLQNIYTKLELRGRSARTAAVARLLTKV